MKKKHQKYAKNRRSLKTEEINQYAIYSLDD